ncbi:potassium channel family protein [Candidatus Mycoplasma mahonii]|uniref:potassium channel family protein n=1 Tax=Candidatus Mycoplasma mahonii TaxID=3004105 RepID=UPI0026EB49CC|nr:TrkA family potassium uptake protein [Candidatus Mycoplasma mahonii]WKX02732.1 TrkA family potassium uptake protein [Candidatus Mycoplasma mahonii]
MNNKKDIAVIGVGKFGLSVVEQLVEMKKFVLAIDIDERKLIQPARIATTAIADAADIGALRELGIPKFKTIIVAAEDNIEIVAALSELGVKHIIAKAKSKRHERVLEQIGVDIIVRPEAEAGIRTALIATNANFIKYSSLLQEIGDGYAIGSTEVSDTSLTGTPVKDLHLQQVKIVSVKRGTRVHIVDGNFILQEGDIVTIVGKIVAITKAYQTFNDESKATKLIKLEKTAKARTRIRRKKWTT